MNIIIVGCGKIGTTVLSNLAAEGHNVTAVDEDPSVIQNITNIYDVMGVCGNGTDCATLEEAEVNNADMFVAVTESDELNMLSCFIAKRMGAKHTIARIRNPEYNDRSLSFMCQQLDLSMSINPEMLAAQELYNMLRLPSAAKVETFSSRSFEMIEMRLRDDSPLSGVSLSQLRDRYRANFLICAVQRGEELYIPDGNFHLQSGDKIGIVATPSELQKLFRAMGVMQKQAKNVQLLGGSKTAFYLSKLLLANGSAVKIIERRREACDELCEKLPNATIINGDGAQQELLLEEGISTLDAFVALTGADEVNILISMFASAQKVPKVIAKVNRDELIVMAENLGLDSIVSAKKLVADKLVQYARALENSRSSKVETLYKLMDGRAEALEFTVGSDSPIKEIPLRELSFKPNVLIAGIVRDRKTIIPSGSDMLMAGDRVIVIAANQRLNDLSEIVK